jgi:hypothetical protein
MGARPLVGDVVTIVTDMCATVTRSHKANDRDHKGLAEGTAVRLDYLPRYFAKTGHVDVDPKKVKKDGNGRGNWYVELILLACHFLGRP